jgi:hypothetical protein
MLLKFQAGSSVYPPVLVEFAFKIPSKNRTTVRFVNNVNNLQLTRREKQNYTIESTYHRISNFRDIARLYSPPQEIYPDVNSRRIARSIKWHRFRSRTAHNCTTFQFLKKMQQGMTHVPPQTLSDNADESQK